MSGGVLVMSKKSEHECFQEICSIIENHIDHKNRPSYEGVTDVYQKENVKNYSFCIDQDDFSDVLDFFNNLEKNAKYKNSKKYSKKNY